MMRTRMAAGREKRLRRRLFSDPFAMRVFATGYHGNEDPEAVLLLVRSRRDVRPVVSRGYPPPSGVEGHGAEPRTDYIVLGPRECLLFITANARGLARMPDRVYSEPRTAD